MDTLSFNFGEDFKQEKTTTEFYWRPHTPAQTNSASGLLSLSSHFALFLYFFPRSLSPTGDHDIGCLCRRSSEREERTEQCACCRRTVHIAICIARTACLHLRISFKFSSVFCYSLNPHSLFNLSVRLKTVVFFSSTTTSPAEASQTCYRSCF